ncbi:3-oxoacyl-ACP synthase [Niastella koreensis]|uniref:Beta-ketoacyl-acyl-carrier-protein synthase III n=2 Tax=Niastella koreensis TaxID=354356 RepID=G8TPK1_NIAKG|nr:3-oxoacyl-ACP synthase III family protein [Niastella koreensis]AEV97822.1 Beta-ketoacyl-acyl-carrier-protein synthase III [Niastella koreensis GR20-10]OQP40369.1 3-oxoacyl-ACP synthase [Niastella koreensis]
MSSALITGTGCYIPPVIKKNSDFVPGKFYTENNLPINVPMVDVIEKFRAITGIRERRYAPDEMSASHMAAQAAQAAIADAGIDQEQIDQIIVAHNYGDIQPNSVQSDTVPSLASRVKNLLGIRNPFCVPYDILFGCPGWLQGVIQAYSFIQAGMAKTCLVIGTETLSRVVDVHDRDSMIFSDGAGACIIERKEAPVSGGVLGTCTRSDTMDEVNFIHFGASYAPETRSNTCFIKMRGRKVYEYAIRHVPTAMKQCIDQSGVSIKDIKKIFIHQANEKMDEAIVKALYGLYGVEEVPEFIMPMCIQWLGNSSVATIPTLYDLVRKEKIQDQHLNPGDVILFASVGAGMNINAVCYKYV